MNITAYFSEHDVWCVTSDECPEFNEMLTTALTATAPDDMVVLEVKRLFDLEPNDVITVKR